MQNVGQIEYEVGIDTRNLVNAQRDVDRRLQTIGGYADRLQTKFTAVAAAISAALTGIAIEGLVSKVIGAQRQFDVLFASLKTMTGGADQAAVAWSKLEKFAAQTPYSLEQSVRGFVKLKALGLDPSERAMTSFGNTASAMGKDLEQMIEAVADASTGEFERLKEFGIKASKEGDKVALTFRGTTTTIGNSAREITDYLVTIGETDFAGAMSERMKTLDGDISNLQDSLEAFYRSVSQAGVGDAIAAGVRKATEAVTELTASVKEGGLTQYFDKLKPFITAAELAVVSLAGAVAGRLVVAMGAAITQAYAAATAIGGLTIAARGFMGVLTALGGPIGVAITGLALLALNWDKVAGEAKDAATMSEQAANRIAAALKKTGGRAGSDLVAQLADAQREMADIDRELSRTSFPMASPDQLAELRQRRATLVQIARDISGAMGKLAGQGDPTELARRGRPVASIDDAGPPPPPPKPGKPNKGEKFDAKAYLAGLEKASLDGIERVDAAEREALRHNEQLLNEKKINAADAAKAINFIETNAAKERRDIVLRNAEDIRSAIEQGGKEEEAARLKALADEKRRADEIQRASEGAMADRVSALGDPAAEVAFYYARRAEQLALEREAELLSQEEYDATVLSNAQALAVKLLAITDQRVSAEEGVQERLVAGVGAFFGEAASLAQQHAGEMSSTYRALFAVSKGFAIASGTMALYSAALKAMDDPTAITLPQKLANYAAVFAAGGSLLSTISSVSYGGGRQYGGPVSAGSLYRVNETGQPEMFTASTGAQFMLPTASGRVTSADKVGGGTTTVELRVINQFAAASVTQRMGSDGKPEIVIAEVARQIREREGPVWGALGTTNVRGQF